MQRESFGGRAGGLRGPKPNRLSRRVLKRCGEAVLRDPETLSDVLRDERSLRLILHESRLAGKILLHPLAISRVVQEADFLVTLADSEHLLDYLRRHQHLLNRLLDDTELAAKIAHDSRFIEYLLRDQTTLATLLDDERSLALLAQDETRLAKLAEHPGFVKLLVDQPDVFARLFEYPPLREFLTSYPPLLEAIRRNPISSHRLREALLNDPESLEGIATDERTLRKLLEQTHTLDRILHSERAMVRMRSSRKFLDRLIEDPGFVAELFLDPRVVKKLMSNRMLLRGLLQEESVQNAVLDCMPTDPATSLQEEVPAASDSVARVDDSMSLSELLQSPEIVRVFTQDDDLIGCLLEDPALCRKIAEHPTLLRSQAERVLNSESLDSTQELPLGDPPAIQVEPFTLAIESDEPSIARRELTGYWNEFIPHLAPTRKSFLDRFQCALSQIESRNQIPDTLVQILCEDGEVHLRDGSFRFLADSKLPEQLYQVLVRRRYAFIAETDTPRILDCGSQAGLTTYGFKTLYPNARITAIEPAPSPRQAARANLKTAGHHDIEHLAYALAPERGSLPFVLAGDGNRGGAIASLTPGKLPPGKTINVRARPLSDLLRDPVDYLKLDVAGAEVEILADSESELVNVKQLFVEMHDRGNDLPDRLSRLYSILQRNGFETRVVPPLDFSCLSFETDAQAPQHASEAFGVWARRIH